jgi:hypothetical protein
MARQEPPGPLPNPPAPAPIQLTPRQTGILNNPGFLAHYLAESPLTASLKFAPINRWPIIAPWNNEYLIALASVYAEARMAYSQAHNPDLKKAMIMGETLSPMIPATKYSDQQSARISVITWIKWGMIHEIFDALGDYNNLNFQEFKALPEIRQNFNIAEMPAVYPPPHATIETFELNQVIFMMTFFAYNLRDARRTKAIECLTLAYCALAKRGQVTQEFCVKIINSIRDELAVNITMTSLTINALYKGYMLGVNETNAELVLNYLDAQLPDIALRLKLTLTQASGSGLTLYIIIGKALRMYHDFQWGRANLLTGGEMANWNAAMDIIGNNLYYGFKRDLGAARSTLYKSIGYVAKELLVKINGEVSLERYGGLSGNIKNKAALDRLITAYVNAYRAEEGGETAAMREILKSVNDLNEIGIFA